MKGDPAIESMDALIEDFQARLRQGENPSIAEYVAEYPNFAAEIKEILPTVKAMEEFKEKREALSRANLFPGIKNLSRLGEYKIIREIGRGGMGIVYEAFQESLHRPVAIKVLPWLSQENETVLKRFEREARIAARLEYPHIIPIYGFGKHEGIHYYVMQYIRGISLSDLISFLIRQKPQDLLALFDIKTDCKSRIPGQNTLLKSVVNKYLATSQLNSTKSDLPPTEVSHKPDPPPIPPLVGMEERAIRRLYAQLPMEYYKEISMLVAHVANALHYAHEQKAIHRDIKPSNLILDTQGTVWIADFGLAKELFSENLTATGDILGTVRYMAPEFFDGKGDARSDIYCLGLTLSELLTLQPVFTERGSKLVHRIIAGQVPMPRRKNPHIPPALEAIVARAVVTDPEKRYVSGREMEKDLKLFMERRAKASVQQAEQAAGKTSGPALLPSAKSFYVYLALLVLSGLLLFRFWPVAKENVLAEKSSLTANSQLPAPEIKPDEKPPPVLNEETPPPKDSPPEQRLTTPPADFPRQRGEFRRPGNDPSSRPPRWDDPRRMRRPHPPLLPAK